MTRRHSRVRPVVLALPLVAASALLISAPPRAARAQAIDRIVVFGDSLADPGNLAAYSGGLVPPTAQYPSGRFSDSAVAVERLNAALAPPNPAANFAYGGARTDNTNLFDPNFIAAGVPPPPGMAEQVGGYIASAPTFTSSTLFVLWGGANDFLNGGQTDPTVPAGNIGSQINLLAGAGARRFLVANLADLGRTPGAATNPVGSATLTARSIAFNTALGGQITTIRQNQPGLDIRVLDVFSLFNAVLANPAPFGFTNVTQSYLAVTGNNPTALGNPNVNTFLFYDDVHPTGAGHQILANQAVAVLNAPEPTSAALVAVPVFAACAAGVIRRRRKAVAA
jgi:outer membrane lipase/esterase